MSSPPLRNSNQSLLNSLGTMLWHADSSSFHDTTQVLANKIVLLYFSASWCAPCQKFTPLLSQTYRTLKQQNNNNNNKECLEFDIVFISMDRTEEQYATYCSKMPFFAMPFGKDYSALARQCHAGSIPHLVVFDTDGTMIRQDGVGELTLDPSGTRFPWRPKPFSEILPSHCIYATEQEPKSMLDWKDKYLMLYFSAHWCPPCQTFTPLLAKAYTKLKASAVSTQFELLFVSADDSQEAFDAYFYSDMNFGAIPFSNITARTGLLQRLAIRGYPTLLMLSPTDHSSGDRTIVNANIRGIIETGDYLSEFPYNSKLYGDLNHTPMDINDHKCLIVFHEGGDDTEQNDIMDAVKRASSCVVPDLQMYWAMTVTSVSKSVREALQLDRVTPDAIVLLLDIPDCGAYYISQHDGPVTQDVIVNFVNAPGKRQQMKG